jgi:hypothetical protein
MNKSTPLTKIQKQQLLEILKRMPKTRRETVIESMFFWTIGNMAGGFRMDSDLWFRELYETMTCAEKAFDVIEAGRN